MSSKKGALGFLYGTAIGRAFLKVLTAVWLSKLCGAFLDSRLSKPLIKGFIKSNGIDLNDYTDQNFGCFNDCFCRKIRPELRPIDTDDNHLIAPCDGSLSAYKISGDTVLPVKQSLYTVDELLGGDPKAKDFYDGVCLVFRLAVDNYHRYCYFDDGTKGENTFIKGKLHTVRPIALGAYPVFKQNCREYTVIESNNFGTAIQVEVGAMLVGKIKNHHGRHTFNRGDEKGTFLYGGSTIILLLKKGAAKLDEKYFTATENGNETPVKMGECIGKK